MMNPYKAERLKRGLTQKQVATYSGVTTQVVTNLESGLYYKPPIRLDPTQHLATSYRKWVRFRRQENSFMFNDYTLSDFEMFRISITPSFRGFCRLLVFQPSMLQEYEAYGYNRDALNKALKGVGIPRDNRTILLGYGVPR